MPYHESSPGRLHCEHETYCPLATTCETLDHDDITTWNALIALIHAQERKLVPVGTQSRHPKSVVYGSELACAETHCSVLLASQPFEPNRPVSADFEEFGLTTFAIVQIFNLGTSRGKTTPDRQAAD